MPSKRRPARPARARVVMACLAACGALVAAGAAHAGPYSAEYVFGDSLSDNGNLAELFSTQPGHPTTGFPNPPSYHDSFTNGPVALADLAAGYGLSLNPSLWLTSFHDPANLFGGASFVPGTNYAVAGATSAAQAPGGPAAINLPQQLAAYTYASHGVADPNALYVVMIGGNDVRNAAIQDTSGLLNAAAQTAIATGVQTEIGAVQTLASEGAQHLLVVNVPNVGVIPEFAEPGYDGSGKSALATQLSQLYDSELASGIAGLALPGATLFDLYGYNTSVLANAASYGFTNTSDPCYLQTPYSSQTSQACGTGARNIGSFIYWDTVHPTQQVHALWASAIAADLATPAPEPASIAVLGAGLLGLVRLRRRSA